MLKIVHSSQLEVGNKYATCKFSHLTWCCMSVGGREQG